MFIVREDLTPENILSKISDYDIFKAYCKNFKEVGIKFNSEMREDAIPSCVITFFNGSLWYKDFGDFEKSVNCFGYVQRKYKCTFPQALGLINLDFNLGLKQYEVVRPSLNYIGLPDIHIPKFTERKDTIINVEYRDWLFVDKDYWNGRYNLSFNRLEFYDIRPIRKLFLNNEIIKMPIETYAFLIDIEDSIEKFKIYSPFSKKLKWLSNCKAHHYQGFNQLPWIHNKLIITKSLKDVAVLSLFKIPSIAPQSEAQLIPFEFMERLRKRFKNIYLFFDNDVAGRKGSEKNSLEHNLPQLFIPERYGEKDISDMMHKYSFTETEELIKTLIK